MKRWLHVYPEVMALHNGHHSLCWFFFLLLICVCLPSCFTVASVIRYLSWFICHGSLGAHSRLAYNYTLTLRWNKRYNWYKTIKTQIRKNIVNHFSHLEAIAECDIFLFYLHYLKCLWLCSRDKLSVYWVSSDCDDLPGLRWI